MAGAKRQQAFFIISPPLTSLTGHTVRQPMSLASTTHGSCAKRLIVADREALEAAIWAGDTDALNQLAPCKCCCAEHTFFNCPARAWYGCRGQTAEVVDEDAWAAFYRRTRGMSEDTFFGPWRG